MTITLSIAGMTCSHCAHTVTKTLQGVSGVDKVSVTLSDGSARVEGNAEAPALIQAVEGAGYKARVASSK